MIGIYKITNKSNGKSYIGQSIHCGKRLDEHCNGDQLIDEVIQIEGVENFNFEILKECNKNELSFWEDFYIMKFETMFPKGYNKKWNCSKDLRDVIKMFFKNLIDKNVKCEKEEIADKEKEYDEEPWKHEILNQEEKGKIMQWDKEFGEKYCGNENWIGNFDDYKKYKYNKRKNMQNRGRIPQLKKIVYSDKIFTQAQLNRYDDFRWLINWYNDKITLWHMKDELCWSDAIYGPNGKESGYAPVSCGIYITKKDLGWCKVEFRDRKIIIDEIKFDNRGITNGMLVKLFKSETINISNFKFFKDEMEIPAKDLIGKEHVNIDKIEILEEQAE